MGDVFQKYIHLTGTVAEKEKSIKCYLEKLGRPEKQNAHSAVRRYGKLKPDAILEDVSETETIVWC